jgi:hypothetical protein
VGWGYSVTVDGYIIAGQQGYAQPTFTADRRWLHLEARYNYENLRTGSLWAGYNFVWGKEWHFAFTPMIGGVFGRTNGIAPGCEASIAWKLLGVSLSNEYLFDTTSKSGNSYYAWPQLSLQPLNWLQFGAVAERTKVNLAHPVLRGGVLRRPQSQTLRIHDLCLQSWRRKHNSCARRSGKLLNL